MCPRQTGACHSRQVFVDAHVLAMHAHAGLIAQANWPRVFKHTHTHTHSPTHVPLFPVPCVVYCVMYMHTCTHVAIGNFLTVKQGWTPPPFYLTLTSHPPHSPVKCAGALPLHQHHALHLLSVLPAAPVRHQDQLQHGPLLLGARDHGLQPRDLHGAGH